MSVRLGSNIASLTAQRRLAEGTTALSRTFERLSSGQRINRASDDAAGLAIADALRAESRIFNQGVRNLNDGISLFNIADSAVENLSGIMTRLEELAEQSANGTYGVQQRKALDAEAQALSKEYFRISKTTKFNGRRLLSGDFDKVNLQAGVGTNAVLSAGVGGAIGMGTFAPRVSYSVGSGPYSVSSGDFNGDGVLDLATADLDSNAASVLLGLGDGTFAPRVSYSVGIAPMSVSTGDFNGDGVLDLVTADFGSHTTSVLLGLGNGTFAPRVSYSVGASPISVSTGDFNGDGVLDLVNQAINAEDAEAEDVRIQQGDFHARLVLLGKPHRFRHDRVKLSPLLVAEIREDIEARRDGPLSGWRGCCYVAVAAHESDHDVVAAVEHADHDLLEVHERAAQQFFGGLTLVRPQFANVAGSGFHTLSVPRSSA